MVTLKRFSKAVMLPQDGVYAPETMFFLLLNSISVGIVSLLLTMKLYQLVEVNLKC